ncbi:hypothetical protein HNW13_019050 [Shewanella sp. BF02_Schw]|jgi:hypothetical protein|uniref:hypothetical protein n=1 Tax=Shewanella sp. BF02_Schw TaxID=394908 RepID=UPI001783DB6F|nr:hypothetical protein [Shewanella sp. BF02_Schw]MBO1897840.1 hypothetical protein [Shewanella sp. BF02_Schw]
MKRQTKKKSDDDIVGLFPPMKSIGAFLAATLSMILSIALLNLLIFDFYFEMKIEHVLMYLFTTTIIFSGVNFAVVRGSFFAVKVLQWYFCILFIIFLPTVFLIAEQATFIYAYLLAVVFLLMSLYLLQSKYYQIFVEYQFDALEDIKEVRAEIAAEVAADKAKHGNKF